MILSVESNTDARSGKLRAALQNQHPARQSRIGLYVVSLGVWISGALWLLFHNFLVKQGEFGPSR